MPVTRKLADSSPVLRMPVAHRTGAAACYLGHCGGVRRQRTGVLKQVLPLEAQFLFLIGRGAQLDVPCLQADVVLQRIFHHPCNVAVEHNQQGEAQGHGNQREE